MTIRGVLDGLVERAGATGPPGLKDAVSGLRSARVWEGPWDAVRSPGRASLATPAALVSLIDLEVTAVGRTLADRRSLAPAGGGARRSVGAARPVCRLEIAVTLLGGGSGTKSRAADVLDLVEEVLVVMADHALEGIGGANLDSDALRAKGLSAFVLSGRREIEIGAAAGERVRPARVDVAGRTPRTVWPPPEC